MKLIKYFFEAIIVYFLFILIKIIGLNFGRKAISFLFLKIGPLIKSEKTIKKNISIVFGNIDENEINKIIKSMWKNYAYIFVEYIFLYKYRLNKFKNFQVNINGKNILSKIAKSNKPVIFVSGHFANFELMAMELEKNHINVAAIYRPLNNIFLNPFMVYLRKKHICKNQVIKGKTGTRETIEFMKKNFSIALMVDQRLGESERINFFKKPAHTTTLPAQLALRFECDIVPIYLERKKDNTFELEILEPIKLNKTDNVSSDKEILTKRINEVIEKMILRNPGQWIWTHNRWK